MASVWTWFRLSDSTRQQTRSDGSIKGQERSAGLNPDQQEEDEEREKERESVSSRRRIFRQVHPLEVLIVGWTTRPVKLICW